jgi:hypothetical protein
MWRHNRRQLLIEIPYLHTANSFDTDLLDVLKCLVNSKKLTPNIKLLFTLSIATSFASRGGQVTFFDDSAVVAGAVMFQLSLIQ